MNDHTVCKRKKLKPMSKEAEQHLAKIKRATTKQMDEKYRKGHKEHGGDILGMSAIDLCENAIDEATDQLTYLLSLRAKLLKQIGGKIV